MNRKTTIQEKYKLEGKLFMFLPKHQKKIKMKIFKPKKMKPILRKVKISKDILKNENENIPKSLYQKIVQLKKIKCNKVNEKDYQKSYYLKNREALREKKRIQYQQEKLKRNIVSKNAKPL